MDVVTVIAFLWWITSMIAGFTAVFSHINLLFYLWDKKRIVLKKFGVRSLDIVIIWEPWKFLIKNYRWYYPTNFFGYIRYLISNKDTQDPIIKKYKMRFKYGMLIVLIATGILFATLFLSIFLGIFFGIDLQNI